MRASTRRAFFVVVFAAFWARSASAGLGPDAFPPMGEALGEEAVTLPSKGENGLRDALEPGLSGSRTSRAENGLRDALRDSPSFEKSLRGLHSGSASVQRESLRSLARPNNTRAIPYLGALLMRSDADPRIRIAAVHALGRIGDWRAVDFLRGATEDTDVNVRVAAALALGKLRNNEAVGLLEENLMKDGHWWVRYAGTIALGDSRNPAAVPVLVKALADDPCWQVRQQAARSLGEYRTKTSMDSLGQALRDSDPAVRYAAARELGNIGGLDSLELLRGATELEREGVARDRMTASIKKLVSSEEP
jgi:HEAT repeat protein